MSDVQWPQFQDALDEWSDEHRYEACPHYNGLKGDCSTCAVDALLDSGTVILASDLRAAITWQPSDVDAAEVLARVFRLLLTLEGSPE